MMKPAILSIFAWCALAQPPVPPQMPAWLAPFPGARVEKDQRSSVLIRLEYRTPERVRDVDAYYRRLLDSYGANFTRSAFGYGFTLSAAPPECDLTIAIDRGNPDTSIRITCAAKIAGTERIRAEHAAAEAERRAAGDPMKKFDNPVYPEQTAPIWPSWLVRVDGAALAYHKSAGRLVSTFDSQPTREAIAAFYSGLLIAHGYRMSGGGSWLVAIARPDHELGRNTTIWVKIKPAGSLFTVELSVQ